MIHKQPTQHGVWTGIYITPAQSMSWAHLGGQERSPHFWSFSHSLFFILFYSSGTSLYEQRSQDQNQIPPTLHPQVGWVGMTAPCQVVHPGKIVSFPGSHLCATTPAPGTQAFPGGCFPIIRCVSPIIYLIYHKPLTSYSKIYKCHNSPYGKIMRQWVC